MDVPALADESAEILWRLREVTLAGRTSPRLDRITFDIPRGITAVLGESGAGKTSLLNVLVGFEEGLGLRAKGLGTEEDSGSNSSPSLNPQPSALSLFWAPPDHGLWPQRTVRQHLLNGDESLLDAFALRSVAAAYPATLSAGERSRLAVARAVSSGATVLVLDEPFANVDSAMRAELWNALIEITRRQSQSLVIATHHPDVAIGFAEHVICLAAGRVLAAGSPQELYHRPPNREVAERFGRCNWFSVEEAGAWLPNAPSPCVRPEQLAIEPVDSSAIRVEAVTFAGDHEEVRLRSEQTGLIRSFIHRPARPQLRSGDCVQIRWLT